MRVRWRRVCRRTDQRLFVVACCLALGGCASSVQVKTVRTDSLVQKMRANVLTSDAPSPRTLQTLRRYDLETSFRSDPCTVLKELGKRLREHPDPADVFAMAELCHFAAKKSEAFAKPRALHLYLGAAAYSYYYLFDDSLGGPPSEYDPRFRLACDLYNRSVAKIIALAQKQDIELKDSLRLQFVDGALDLKITRFGFPWSDEDFGKFKFASDYEVRGLENQYQTFGLGVPLIALRTPPESRADAPEPSAPEVQRVRRDPDDRTGRIVDKYLPRTASFPATAFLRMDGKLCDVDKKITKATLELYDPLYVQQISVAGRPVPLESDLTTPLGYYLSQSKIDQFAFVGLFKTDRVLQKSGLYFAEPYAPGKIPVVMVHGLWSSPMTWMGMFNDLRGDPILRKHYQFCFFLYPTGNPFIHSAALLRKSLNQVRRDFDPYGKDPALDQMVLVGHSMGGLVSKLMVQQSQSQVWDLMSTKPVTELALEEGQRAELQQTFFFEPQPFVKRIVFIATPHRGSNVANRPIGRLATSLISLPQKLVDQRTALLLKNPNAFTPLFSGALPTSVDTLSPDSSIIQTVAKLPIDRRVHFHSIIGNLRPGEKEAGNDGVVPYTSAHLDGAESELIVAGNHNCHCHPRSVLEVRRILLDHLEQSATELPVRPAIHEASEVGVSETKAN